MQVARLTIENFRGIAKTELHFSGHTLLIGGNNVGKSTVCEALDLVLGPDRLYRTPPVEEFDFRNAAYLATDGATPIPIRIDVVLTDLTEEITRQCAVNLEFWHKKERRLLAAGEIYAVDKAEVESCLRLVTIARYDPEEDQFFAKTIYGNTEGGEDDVRQIPTAVKRSIGFLYLRTLRTGSRALSLERGSLLDMILRMKEVRTDLWEKIRKRLLEIQTPIDEDATVLGPILDEIEARLTEYIATAGDTRATRLFVSQLTREHLRKTIAFFLTVYEGETPVPFQDAVTGTLNTLVLALLTFIAEIKKDNIIFAMEEPEIALPPHTQRRIATLFGRAVMLIIVSDLHLTDGTSGTTIQSDAFDIFKWRLRNLAYAASCRMPGSTETYKPIDDLCLLLLGDTLDTIRSTSWLRGTVRPWDDNRHSKEFVDKVSGITADILRNNRQS